MKDSQSLVTVKKSVKHPLFSCGGSIIGPLEEGLDYKVLRHIFHHSYWPVTYSWRFNWEYERAQLNYLEVKYDGPKLPRLKPGDRMARESGGDLHELDNAIQGCFWETVVIWPMLGLLLGPIGGGVALLLMANSKRDEANAITGNSNRIQSLRNDADHYQRLGTGLFFILIITFPLFMMYWRYKGGVVARVKGTQQANIIITGAKEIKKSLNQEMESLQEFNARKISVIEFQVSLYLQSHQLESEQMYAVYSKEFFELINRYYDLEVFWDEDLEFLQLIYGSEVSDLGINFDTLQEDREALRQAIIKESLPVFVTQKIGTSIFSKYREHVDFRLIGKTIVEKVSAQNGPSLQAPKVSQAGFGLFSDKRPANNDSSIELRDLASQILSRQAAPK